MNAEQTALTTKIIRIVEGTKTVNKETGTSLIIKTTENETYVTFFFKIDSLKIAILISKFMKIQNQQAKQPTKFEEDFNFEAANAEFEKLKKDLDQKLKISLGVNKEKTEDNGEFKSESLFNNLFMPEII